MNKFRTILILIAVILLCFVLQTSVLPTFAVQGMTSNLMIIVASSYGFMFGADKGMLIGLSCGLLCDIFFGPLIGFYAAVYALVGFLSGKFRKILYVEDLGFPLLLVCLSDLLYGFLVYVFLFMLRNRLFFRAFLVSRMLPEMTLTVIAAVPLYPILRFLYNRFMEPHRRPARSSTPEKEDGADG